MERKDFNPKSAGFAAFRTGWPNYRSSVFKDKVEIVTDGRGKIIGVTNPQSLLWAELPSSAEGIQIIEVGEKAFSECTNLRSISFSSNLEYVAPFAFSGCRRLENVVFASEEIEFGEGVFDKSGLKSFVFPPLNSSVPPRFFQDCVNLSSITLPKRLKEIGVLSFAGTKNLRSIDLGFYLNAIPDGAFLGSGLESISLPGSLKGIGISAFSGCLNLESIWYDGRSEAFRSLDFGMHWNKGINHNAVLYVKDENGAWHNAFEKEKSDRKERVEREENEVKKHLKVFGLEELPTREKLNEVYRREARKFHPDTIASLNLAPEYAEFAASRFREIHDSYLELMKVIESSRGN